MSLPHFSPFFSLSHTNTGSIHKTHFEIQDVNILTFCKPKFVVVYMQYQKAYIQKKRLQSRHCNDAVVYKNRNTHRKRAEWLEGACLQFACILISPLCKALLKHCVWSTSVRSAERMAAVAALLSFWLHFSTLASVAYNKTRLWKHFGVPTCTDKFKYQQGDMTKRAPTALCQCSCKQH